MTLSKWPHFPFPLDLEGHELALCFEVPGWHGKAGCF